MLFDATLFSTQHYKVRVYWSNPMNGVAPSPTHFGVVAIEKGAHTHAHTNIQTHTYIYIYIYVFLLLITF